VTAVAALTGAGLVAFLSSALLLWSGVSSMPIRYGVVTAIGYAAFLLLLRAAISMRPSDADPGLDIGLPDLSSGGPQREGATTFFEGGASGGGGGGASWGDATPNGVDGAGVGLDVDGEALPFALIGVVAAAGLIAVGVVVHTAPILLAEIALDVALVSALTRRLPRGDARHWIRTAVGRTWLPACGVVLSMVILGLFFTWLAPEATSVGGVFDSRGVE
jgi:hypothetical protein